MIKRILLYFALLLWFVVPAAAQPTFTFPTTSVEPGTEVTVDLTVADFADILSMQFSISWDPAVLEFDTLDNLALPMYSAMDFNFTVTNEGKLGTVWTDQNFTGVSLDDNDVLMTLHFTAVGDDGSSTSFEFIDDPTDIEVADANATVLDVIVEGGSISIDQLMTTSGVQANAWMTLQPNEPNPFNNQTFIRFDLRQSQVVALEVFDLNGRLVLDQRQFFIAGEHTFQVDAAALPGNGTYLYTIKTEDYSFSNKMVLIR